MPMTLAEMARHARDVTWRLPGKMFASRCPLEAQGELRATQLAGMASAVLSCTAGCAAEAVTAALSNGYGYEYLNGKGPVGGEKAKAAPRPARGLSLSESAARVEGVKWRGDEQFSFRCPSHDDRQASASATLKNGKILLKCFAGCTSQQMIDALGVTFAQLFASPNGGKSNRSQTRYEIRGIDGQVVAVHVREDWPGGKRMWWELADGTKGLSGIRTENLPLYGLDKLAEGAEPIICEGEKDTQALIDRGLPALGTVTGAASCPSEASLAALTGRRVVLWPDNDDAGEQHMRKVGMVLTRLAISYRVLTWPEAPEKGGAADFTGSIDEIRELIAGADAPPKPEPPRPLKRDVGRAEPYPHQALGPVLSQVAEAVQAATQVPMAIASQSVLATANFCVQAHVNVELPTGDIKPVSEYFLTLAESGERKTAADERALQGVRAREQALAEVSREEWKLYKNDLEAYEKQRTQVLASTKNADRAAKRQALGTLGDEPKLPRGSILLCGDPTFEGLVRLLRDGHGYCGIFSSEGGMFVGGHGMSDEAKLRTITGLSAIWDGLPVKRTRGGDGNHTLPGRRVYLALVTFQIPEALADRTQPVVSAFGGQVDLDEETAEQM
jgi:uncharacterized protein DUF3987